MIRKKYYKQKRQKTYVTANHRIRFPEVRVLSKTGEMLGVMSSQEALNKAQAAATDLVLVTDKAKPPIVKIIDLDKFKYQQQQKAAKNRKSAKSQDLKEVRFTLFMGEHDLQTATNKVLKFLKKGDKVRLSLQFKGRMILRKEFGYQLFEKVIAKTQEIADLEIRPRMMGKKLIAQLMPVKK